LYVILTGECKVKKRADKTEILGRLLADANQKALSHDVKYRFHHRLRNMLAPVDKNDLRSRVERSSFEAGDSSDMDGLGSRQKADVVLIMAIYDPFYPLN
jgi:hypothetical protein